jgi:hypothetical protein
VPWGSVAETKAAAQAGVDGIIVQGVEAGKSKHAIAFDVAAGRSRQNADDSGNTFYFYLILLSSGQV